VLYSFTGGTDLPGPLAYAKTEAEANFKAYAVALQLRL